MPRAAKRNTPYGYYIQHIVGEFARAGRASITFNDVAEAAKLKLTPNLRRRIHELVQRGYLVYQINPLGGKQLFGICDAAKGLGVEQS